MHEKVFLHIFADFILVLVLGKAFFSINNVLPVHLNDDHTKTLVFDSEQFESFFETQ